MTATAAPIYLDFNATTPVAPEVIEAMMPYLITHHGNPSSDHAYGRTARAGLERAREEVADLIGANPDEIVFTSGGTESNNLALRGAAAALPASRRTVVLTTLEHPAVTGPCAALGNEGWAVERIAALPSGSVELGDMEARLSSNVGLVTAMLAQNETGAMLPVAVIAAAGHAAGAVVHTDAAQAVGKVPVDVSALGVDLMSIAGHKMYAPKGVGALYVRRGTRLEPFTRGAGQEFGLRPGTESVAFAVALGAAARLAGSLMATEPSRVGALRDLLWARLSATVPCVRRLTPDDALPNTLLVAFPDVIGSEVLSRAPGVAASTGSACHAGTHTPSATLNAMGVAANVALGAVRLSLGRTTTEAEIVAAVEFIGGAGLDFPS